MSMLQKFRSDGGFRQLVRLIELCEPHRQRTLMDAVRSEDPGWAQLIRIKMLSVERILTWPENTLRKILNTAPTHIVVPIYHSCPDKFKSVIANGLGEQTVAEVEVLCREKVIDEHEVFAARLGLIQMVREMEHSGAIDFMECDPTLVIDENSDSQKRVA